MSQIAMQRQQRNNMSGIKEEYAVIHNLCWEAYADGITETPAVTEYVLARYKGEMASQINDLLIEMILTDIREQMFDIPEDMFNV